MYEYECVSSADPAIQINLLGIYTYPSAVT